MLGYQRWISSHPSCVSNVDVSYVDWWLAINYATDIVTLWCSGSSHVRFIPDMSSFRDKIYVRADLFSKAKLSRYLLIDDLTTTTTNRIYYCWYAKNYSFQGSYLRNIISYFLLFCNSYDSSSFSNIFSRHFSTGIPARTELCGVLWR